MTLVTLVCLVMEAKGPDEFVMLFLRFRKVTIKYTRTPNPVLMVEAPGLEPSKISAPEKLKVFLDPPQLPSNIP